MPVQQTWTLENHLCKACGGRILRCATGSGPTPGGNPLYRCADCGRCSSGMGPQILCWCGFEMRGQHATAYRCMPFSAIKDRPELAAMFGACGCDPKRGTAEVGIVLVRDLHSNAPAKRAAEGGSGLDEFTTRRPRRDA